MPFGPEGSIPRIFNPANNNEQLSELDPLSLREVEGLQVDGLRLADLRDFRTAYFEMHPDTTIESNGTKNLAEVIAIINLTPKERYRLDPRQYIAILDRYDELLKELDASAT